MCVTIATCNKVKLLVLRKFHPLVEQLTSLLQGFPTFIQFQKVGDPFKSPGIVSSQLDWIKEPATHIHIPKRARLGKRQLGRIEHVARPNGFNTHTNAPKTEGRHLLLRWRVYDILVTPTGTRTRLDCSAQHRCWISPSVGFTGIEFLLKANHLLKLQHLKRSCGYFISSKLHQCLSVGVSRQVHKLEGVWVRSM